MTRTSFSFKELEEAHASWQESYRCRMELESQAFARRFPGGVTMVTLPTGEVRFAPRPNPEHMRIILEAVRVQRLSGNSGEGRRIIDAVLAGDTDAAYYPDLSEGNFNWS